MKANMNMATTWESNPHTPSYVRFALAVFSLNATIVQYLIKLKCRLNVFLFALYRQLDMTLIPYGIVKISSEYIIFHNVSI